MAAPIFGACRAPLRKWFKAHARDLPWRAPYSARASDADTGFAPPDPSHPAPRRPPYAVWVSEIMLQQTQVAAVVSHFERWMAQFPTASALAAAPEEQVLRAWAGLGYYARARNLHKGAKALVSRGAWPRSAAEWESIPGVGAYTAGAVASIAFGRREPILDGNVIRVFSRLLGLNFLPGGGAAEKRAYWELARLWADAEHPAELNEALMELGALVCSPAAPRCDACPLQASCTARKGGWQGILPPAKPRAKPGKIAAIAVVGSFRGRVLVERRPPGAFLAGHEMFPLFLEDAAAPSLKAWREAFRRDFPDLEITAAKPVGGLRHAIMSKIYAVEVWSAALAPRKKSGPAAGSRRVSGDGPKWLPAGSVPVNLTNSLARKIWAVAGGTPTA